MFMRNAALTAGNPPVPPSDPLAGTFHHHRPHPAPISLCNAPAFQIIPAALGWPRRREQLDNTSVITTN